MERAKDLEIEIKLRLESFPNYLKLLGSVGEIEEERLHVSAFFDTARRDLRKGGWALRVRAENDRGLVTVKGASSREGLAVVRQEMEAEIERGLALEVIGGFYDVLKIDAGPVAFIKKEFPGHSMVKLVQFHNTRQLKHFRIGDHEYLLEIDKTEFADGSTEYELEVEVDDHSQIEVIQDHLKKMFDSLGIPFEREARSKFRRALDRLIDSDLEK